MAHRVMTVREKSSRDVVYYFTIRKPGKVEDWNNGIMGEKCYGLRVAILEMGHSITERTEGRICVYFNPSLIKQNTPPWLFRLS